MGRGRAKAKQVKVARQLKYKSDDTDLDRLRAEFGVGADSGDGNSAGDTTTRNDERGSRVRRRGRLERRRRVAAVAPGRDPTPRTLTTCLPRSPSATGIG